MNAIKNEIGIILPRGIKRPSFIKDIWQPFTVMVNLTPNMAKAWLLNNHLNRPMSESNVVFFTQQMSQGKWQFNGEPIQFDKRGNLLNGQHRCEAVVRSRATIVVNVVVGLEEEAFKTMDTGKPRSAGDVLAIAGISDYALAAATARFIMDYQHGKFFSLGNHSKFNNADILHFAQTTPDFDELIQWARKTYHESGRFMSGRLMAGLCFFFQKVDKFAARDFFRKLCLGVDISRESPIFILRRRLIKEKASKDMRIPNREKAALIIKAFNLILKGETTKHLAWKKSREKFPEIYDPSKESTNSK